MGRLRGGGGAGAGPRSTVALSQLLSYRANGQEGGVEGEGSRIQGNSQKLIKIGENCNLLAVDQLAL